MFREIRPEVGFVASTDIVVKIRSFGAGVHYLQILSKLSRRGGIRDKNPSLWW